MKVIRKFIPVLLVLFFTNCGFSPIYTNINNENLNFNITKSNGNIEINNLIKVKFSEFMNGEAKNNFDVELNSQYKKETLTKNTAGDTTDYRLNLEVIFTTKIKDKLEKFVYQEKSDMKKKASAFEEEKYENILKREMVNLITEKFITQLIISK